jgi:hypothetical protein
VAGAIAKTPVTDIVKPGCSRLFSLLNVRTYAQKQGKGQNSGKAGHQSPCV